MIESQTPGFTSLLSSLSPDGHIRGKQFERVAKWWLTQDPLTSLDIKQAWLWDEWPERSGPDIGIDIVAEMFDGTLCAIQAKCFDENRDIPKSELDSFVSAASPRIFQHRWLIATTDKLSANARRMLDDQHITRILRSDLEQSLENWPASIDELNPIPQPRYSPRPHQDLAITDVVRGLNSNSRGQLIMACGTGKTLTALWIKETLTPKTTLVLVPSLNLLAQTLSEWAQNTSSPWNYLCVCSDDTVNKSDDQPISTVGDLRFDVTTDAEKISAFLSLDGEKIIFSTYQSSAQVAKAQEQSGVSFDLVICDEAHRLTGKTDADYATVLDDKKIVGQKRLFMTATPRTYTTAAKTKAEDRGAEITSMDDEHVYGPVLHKLSFGEAIKQDLLSDYRVLIVGVTDPQVQDLIDRRELISVNDSVNTDARTLAAHIGLAKATKDYNLKRTISFHSRIKSADQFARDHLKILDWLPDTHKPSGNTWTGTISGAMNTGDRRRLIKQLSLDGEDRHALLTNARCLTEGVDVPSLDGVAFIDPRSSQVDIIQAVGRAIRKSANKEIGTIVLPVLIPTDSDAEEALEDTAFKPIWAILNALKSHDDDFAVELNNLRTELGRTGEPGNLPNRLVEDLPVDIDSLLPDFSQKLSVAILEHCTTSWFSMFEALQVFSRREGHANVPAKHFEIVRDNRLSLGAWVTKQRMQFRKMLLTQNDIELLNSVTSWTWDPLNDKFETGYSCLVEYMQKNGTAHVPTAEVVQTADGQPFTLGSWCSVRRQEYLRGVLPKEKQERLQSLEGWVWDPKDSEWMSFYSPVLDYAQEFGSAPKRGFVDDSGKKLGNWCDSTRAYYRSQRLREDRIALMEAIPNWSWNPHDESWESMKDLLIDYLRSNDPNIEAKQLYQGKQLGGWVSKQRLIYKEGKLTESRRLMLEGIQGWRWERPQELSSGIRSDKTLLENSSTIGPDWFDLLNDFIATEGHSYVPANYEIEGKLLGRWARKTRSRYRNKTLPVGIVEKLESIPEWRWEIFEARWEDRLEELRQFAEQNGNLSLSREDTEQNQLASWVVTQRVRYHQEKLTKTQIQLLETIPGWSWAPLQQTWETSFQYLLIYVSREGHVNVPQDHFEDSFPLGRWVNKRRSAMKRGAMTDSEKARLEKIPGWLWSPTSARKEEGFKLLQKFIDREGHARIPAKHTEDNFALGQWVTSRRQTYKRGKMLPDEQHRLEAIKGWTWTVRE